MPTVNLDASNSSQVGSAQKFSILTGEPNTWLFVYAGIAQQNQYADGTSYWIFGDSTAETDASVNVKLDNLSGVLLGFATTAGINLIYEENTWADWGIWSSSLSLQDNGDLVLTASTYVVGGGGGGAGFSGVSYYVSAKILLDAATISGTIRWKKTLASPLDSPHFVITANTQIPGPPGSLFGTTQVEATGVESAVDASDNTYYYVPYTITGGLLGKTVTVNVAPITASFSGAPTFGSLLTSQISGPNPISLTTVNRHATNVDFEMDFVSAPK